MRASINTKTSGVATPCTNKKCALYKICNGELRFLLAFANAVGSNPIEACPVEWVGEMVEHHQSSDQIGQGLLNLVSESEHKF